MTVDPKTLRVGDRVLVEATVGDGVTDRDGDICLNLSCTRDRKAEICIAVAAPSAIHSVLPPLPLEVGDKIRNRHCASEPDSYAPGEILAVVGEWAMVQFPKCPNPGTVRLTDLVRA